MEHAHGLRKIQVAIKRGKLRSFESWKSGSKHSTFHQSAPYNKVVSPRAEGTWGRDSSFGRATERLTLSCISKVSCLCALRRTVQSVWKKEALESITKYSSMCLRLLLYCTSQSLYSHSKHFHRNYEVMRTISTTAGLRALVDTHSKHFHYKSGYEAWRHQNLRIQEPYTCKTCTKTTTTETRFMK